MNKVILEELLDSVFLSCNSINIKPYSISSMLFDLHDDIHLVSAAYLNNALKISSIDVKNEPTLSTSNRCTSGQLKKFLLKRDENFRPSNNNSTI